MNDVLRGLGHTLEEYKTYNGIGHRCVVCRQLVNSPGPYPRCPNFDRFRWRQKTERPLRIQAIVEG